MKKFISGTYLFISALLILTVGGVTAYTMHSNMHRLPLRQYFASEKTNAIWDWRNPTTYSSEEIRNLSYVLHLHQINTVYVDITLYADLQKIEDESQRSQQIDILSSSITQYINTMNNRGIQVFAAAGNTDWSMPKNWSIPTNIQRFVHEYNKTNNDAFAGMQFDIESYNQTGFAEASFTEKELVLLEFLDLVDVLANEHTAYIESSDNPDFELGFAIPYWFDNANQNIKSVSWHDKTGPTLYHLLDRLNQLPRSNVVVMAYRNGALGNDGMIYHSRTEIEYAQSRAPNVDVIIGVEVTDVEPEKITFYGRSISEVSREVSLVHEEFENSGVLGGIGINDVEGFLELIGN